MGFLKNIFGKKENEFMENDERIRAYRKCEHLAYELCRIDIAENKLCEQLERDNPDKTAEECWDMADEAFEEERLQAIKEASMISLDEIHQKEHEYNVNALVNGESLLWKPLLDVNILFDDFVKGLSDDDILTYCVKFATQEAGELVKDLSKERIRKEIADSINKYLNYFDFLNEPNDYNFSDEDAEFIPVCLSCGSLLGDGIYSECVECGEVTIKSWLGMEDVAVCPNCGEPLQEGMSFCGKCGTAVK